MSQKMADAFNLPLRWEPEEGMLPTQIWGAVGSAVAATSKAMHAEAIVRAVNAHDDLVAALEELTRYTYDILTGPIMRRAGIIWPEGGPQSPVLQRARAALAKANSQ